jgi:hypothetical protein
MGKKIPDLAGDHGSSSGCIRDELECLYFPSLADVDCDVNKLTIPDAVMRDILHCSDEEIAMLKEQKVLY